MLGRATIYVVRAQPMPFFARSVPPGEGSDLNPTPSTAEGSMQDSTRGWVQRKYVGSAFSGKLPTAIATETLGPYRNM